MYGTCNIEKEHKQHRSYAQISGVPAAGIARRLWRQDMIARLWTGPWKICAALAGIRHMTGFWTSPTPQLSRTRPEKERP
jgi:hypothetical protein